MQVLLGKAISIQKDHGGCFKWTLFLSHALLVVLTIAMIACGAKAIGTEAIFHGDMSFVYTDYVLSIVFFTISYFACFCVSIWITWKKSRIVNYTVGCYAIYMFILFILISVEGSGLAALEYVNVDDI